MDVTKMLEILKLEYGINSKEELVTAMNNSRGIDIGIFTTPLAGKKIDEKESEVNNNERN